MKEAGNDEVYVLLGTIIVAKIVNDGAEHVLHSASRRVDESLHHLEHAFTARLYVQGALLNSADTCGHYTAPEECRMFSFFFGHELNGVPTPFIMDPLARGCQPLWHHFWGAVATFGCSAEESLACLHVTFSVPPA